jgi:hypothetical protein
MMKSLICILASVLLCTGAAQAETFDVNIVGYGKSENFFEPLSGDIMVTRSGSTMDRFDGLEGTPLEGMTARCFGAATILNGIADGKGNCVFTDPTGNQILQSWTVDEIGAGVAYGTWYFVGGTGRHQGVHGRGHYSQQSDAVSGTNQMEIVGTAKWPEQ